MQNALAQSGWRRWRWAVVTGVIGGIWLLSTTYALTLKVPLRRQGTAARSYVGAGVMQGAIMFWEDQSWIGETLGLDAKLLPDAGLEWKFRHWRAGGGCDPLHGQYVAIPLTAPMGIAAAFALCAYWSPAAVFQRRRRAGLCGMCGFDRRGQDQIGTPCPECGWRAKRT